MLCQPDEHEAAYQHVRNIVSDDFGQLPNDEATVRGDACEPVAVDSHVDDLSGWTKDGGQLEECAITAGARNDANTTPGHGVSNPVGRSDGSAW